MVRQNEVFMAKQDFAASNWEVVRQLPCCPYRLRHPWLWSVSFTVGSGLPALQNHPHRNDSTAIVLRYTNSAVHRGWCKKNQGKIMLLQW